MNHGPTVQGSATYLFYAAGAPLQCYVAGYVATVLQKPTDFVVESDDEMTDLTVTMAAEVDPTAEALDDSVDEPTPVQCVWVYIFVLKNIYIYWGVSRATELAFG